MCLIGLILQICALKSDSKQTKNPYQHCHTPFLTDGYRQHDSLTELAHGSENTSLNTLFLPENTKHGSFCTRVYWITALI